MGYGPNRIFIRNHENPPGTPIAPFQDCSIDGVTYFACSNVNNLEFTVDSNSPVCEYDYRPYSSSYPNCCVGEYNLTTETYDGAANTNSVASQGIWGSSFDQMCIGGSISRDSSWPKTNLGIPTPVLENTWVDGLVDSFTLQSPISLTGQEHNVFNANFVAGATPAAIAGYTDSTTVAAAQQTAIPATYPLYSWDCLDEGRDVIHSIDLRIREWNTVAEYDTFVTVGVASGADPDIAGTEGTNCLYEDPSGGNCNDVYDWDDTAQPGFDIINTGFPESTW